MYLSRGAVFFPGCLKLWCAVGCFHHFQSCLDIAITGTGQLMSSHIVPPWSPLTSRPQSIGLKLYFRMTFEWWHFAIKLLVLWICHNNSCLGFFFSCSPQKNILVKNDVKMDKDGLTDLYIQHAIPLPQRDLPKSRWGKMMENKRKQNEPKSENKR